MEFKPSGDVTGSKYVRNWKLALPLLNFNYYAGSVVV
jgi:hypothetical protein